jgi:hypothetical protein
MYWLPPSLKGEDNLSSILALADRFGLTISPELLWELTPWSWAVDWFTNTGDVISNISDSQKYGLVMPYGYMMEHSITKYTYEPVGWKLKDNLGTVQPISFVKETKRRKTAHPFGFGVTDSDLDSGQVAILSALGLSRS